MKLASVSKDFCKRLSEKKIRILPDKLKAVREYCETNQCFGSFWHKAVGKSLSSSFTHEISRKKISQLCTIENEGSLASVTSYSEN